MAGTRSPKKAPAASATSPPILESSDFNSIKPPLKWHGGKHYLARRILELAPRHRTYLEPFFGGGAVLLARDPEDPRFALSAAKDDRGVSEVVCDADGLLTNFWAVLQDPDLFERFRRRVERTPFSEREFALAREKVAQAREHLLRGFKFADSAAVGYATAFFVCCRQSMAGRMSGFAPTSRARTRRGMNEQASAWLSAVDGLPAAHARLRRVAVRTGPALGLLREFDDPSVWAYLDPPYPAETRASGEVYAVEMSAADHAELLALVVTLKARVTLSSYPNPLYDRALRKWRKVLFDLPNNASSRKEKERKQEALYMNYPEGA